MYASLQVALREAAARADIDDLLERSGELGPALRERAAEDVERVGLRRLVPDELEGGAPPDA